MTFRIIAAVLSATVLSLSAANAAVYQFTGNFNWVAIPDNNGQLAANVDFSGTATFVDGGGGSGTLASFDSLTIGETIFSIGNVSISSSDFGATLFNVGGNPAGVALSSTKDDFRVSFRSSSSIDFATPVESFSLSLYRDEFFTVGDEESTSIRGAKGFARFELVNEVPLPASLPLALAGLGGLVALRRRKQAA